MPMTEAQLKNNYAKKRQKYIAHDSTILDLVFSDRQTVKWQIAESTNRKGIEKCFKSC